MRLLFVFVFLLGLVSCGEDEKKNECPKCEEIKGVGFVWHTDGVFYLPLSCGELTDVSQAEGERYLHPKFNKLIWFTGMPLVELAAAACDRIDQSIVLLIRCVRATERSIAAAVFGRVLVNIERI